MRMLTFTSREFSFPWNYILTAAVILVVPGFFYGTYFIFTGLALFCLVLAMHCWRRQRYSRIYFDHEAEPWGEGPLGRDRPQLRPSKIVQTIFWLIVVAALAFVAILTCLNR